jgi:hypothetical protein
MNLARFASLPLLSVALALAAEQPSGLPRTSPFVPAGTAGAGVEASSETIEFAGVTTVGKRTDLIFHDKTTKKNHWIAKGETKEGIAVLNYDERRQQVVVKVNGAEKTLSLRKVASPRAGPRPVAPQPTGFNVPAEPPVAPAVAPAEPLVLTPGAGQGGVATSAAPAAPTPAAAENPEATRIRQETEARMLVSDLLEIGMAQRKAYEEAQRKAAAGEEPAPTAPPGAPQ